MNRVFSVLGAQELSGVFDLRPDNVIQTFHNVTVHFDQSARCIGFTVLYFLCEQHLSTPGPGFAQIYFASYVFRTDPTNTRHWPNVILILSQCSRQWANIKTTLDQRLVFAWSCKSSKVYISLILSWKLHHLNMNDLYECNTYTSWVCFQTEGIKCSQDLIALWCNSRFTIISKSLWDVPHMFYEMLC